MQNIANFFRQTTGSAPYAMEKIAQAGSNRTYVRLHDASGGTCIGCHGTDVRENAAFVRLARHFEAKGLPVPHIIAVSDDAAVYLQEDIGQTSLADWMKNLNQPAAAKFEPAVRAMQALAQMQTIGAEGLTESDLLPPARFDDAAVWADLFYFKDCFLRPLGVAFDETALMQDFRHLVGRVRHIYIKECGETLLLRDFQSRNVLLRADGTPVVIDFQAARFGPVLFDVASFLYQASAPYDDALRERLLRTYHAALSRLRPSTPSFEELRHDLQPFILLRMLGVLGAYGLRGLFERKPHFLSSIPKALARVEKVLSSELSGYQVIKEVCVGAARQGVGANHICPINEQPHKSLAGANVICPYAPPLTVEILSFSFKRGLPSDGSGNGGGYIFDCRSTHNPGRYEAYRHLTGRDAEVVRFLEDDGEITAFLAHVIPLVEAHVRRWQERGFTHLQVAFGCTGGQHRSVYSAERLAAHLRSLPHPPRVVLHHREQDVHEVFDPAEA